MPVKELGAVDQGPGNVQDRVTRCGRAAIRRDALSLGIRGRPGEDRQIQLVGDLPRRLAGLHQGEQPGPPRDLALDMAGIQEVETLGRWVPGDALLVPLRLPQGRWLGLLSLDAPRDGVRPTRRQIRLIELFADHTSVAIHNAQLYAEQHNQIGRAHV